LLPLDIVERQTPAANEVSEKLLCNGHVYGDQVKEDAMGWTCSRLERERDDKYKKITVDKPDWKRPFWRSRRRWDDNIKKD
jgi:hypothetical protein